MGDDIPVKVRQRVEAETLLISSDGREVEIVRGDPRNPVEDTEGAEDVVWEPKVDGHTTKSKQEEAKPGDIEDRPEWAQY